MDLQSTPPPGGQDPVRSPGTNGRSPAVTTHRTGMLPGMNPVTILGVDYWHTRTADGGDLYITRFGLASARYLLPENWFEKQWFEQNREKLEGSSTVYKVSTKPLNGRRLDMVVKWCRVGEEVPFDTLTLNKFAMAEFNSPYEEFALVMEMRGQRTPGILKTHKPLGIYVPAECLQLWQTGRSESKIARKKAKHRDVELDIFRQYILIYQWIKGESITEALAHTQIPTQNHMEIMVNMTRRATADLAARGFRVLDMKPAHIIVRRNAAGDLLRLRSRDVAYALVDFELLERTPEHQQEISRARRSEYLIKQRDRFTRTTAATFPEHLRPMQVFGVDYVFGYAGSTQGALWVAGKEPGLFDYFLPERWRRTRRTELSKNNEVYYTRTKDNINLVWRVSRMGEKPDVGGEDGTDAATTYGYNSPFEEFALALELTRLGVPTVYPRAIYMTGLQAKAPDYIENTSRFESHADLLTPDGHPILSSHHNYITVWGFWNGRDEMLAEPNPVYCEGIDLDLAAQTGHVSKSESARLLDLHRQRLTRAGMEDLNLNGSHVLLSLTPEGRRIVGPDGEPEMRHCNFALMRRIRGTAGGHP